MLHTKLKVNNLEGKHCPPYAISRSCDRAADQSKPEQQLQHLVQNIEDGGLRCGYKLIGNPSKSWPPLTHPTPSQTYNFHT
ncbi:hypothetical protein [Moorena sp. SIO3B2]|uniref:hypothetical protein n=1 Tax=Moorena sp. SIO3B2 TaxID=2607827 RepID=UPI0013C835D3|nr:hypothetical protein [Moorena sp. SIO3B2]NEP33604.1 hypothetical protein [Moorena sp. SIO3B2]